jgi:hypothetical protein
VEKQTERESQTTRNGKRDCGADAGARRRSKKALSIFSSILRKKYGLSIKQFVIYLGQKASKMQTQLSPEEIFTGFTLKSLHTYSYQHLLASDIPEEIILTILSDFESKKPVEVIRAILAKLKEISQEEIILRKYIRQLAMLARLRNLGKETQRQITDMGLTYNITEDYLYQEGQKIKEKELIIEMLKDGTLTIEKIASLAKVLVEYVKQVAKEIKK